MKEFIDQLASHGPQFISTLSEIISGPKRFIHKLNFNEPNALGEALLFNVLCVTVYFILGLPFIDSTKELWRTFVTAIVLFTLISFVVSGCYKICFSCVGGKASLKDHIMVTLYMSGPIYLFDAVMSSASKGILMARDPNLLPLLKEFVGGALTMNPQLENIEKYWPLLESTAGIISVLMAFSLSILVTLWVLITWGSYRYINNVSKLKSIMAFLLAIVISIPISYIFTSIQQTLGMNSF